MAGLRPAGPSVIVVRIQLHTPRLLRTGWHRTTLNVQQGGLQNTESFQKQENNKILCDGKPLRTLGQGGTERPFRCSDVYSCFVITLDCRGSESHTGSKPYPSESRREQTWLLHDYYQRFVCAADQNNFFSSILFQKRWAQSLPAWAARNTWITPSDMTLQC